MKQIDVLCFGIQVLDMVVGSIDDEITRREITSIDSARIMLGGDAVNQAINLSALGNRVALMSVRGSDALGDVLQTLLNQHPIALYEKVVDGDTGISIALISPSGERHFLVRMGALSDFNVDDIDMRVIDASRIVSFGSSLFFPALDGKGVDRVFERAHRAGALTTIDFKVNYYPDDFTPILNNIRNADYVIPSELEASLILGGTDTPANMAHALRDRGAKNVILKIGADGCYVCADGLDQHIPAYPSSCIDTTGAGDAFTAAFLHGISKKWDIETCARFANAAGSITVEHPGASGGIVSEQQVLRRMKAQ